MNTDLDQIQQATAQAKRLQRKREIIISLSVFAVGALSAIFTFAWDVPDDLPGIALGSPVTIYIARFAFYFAVGLALISVADQSLKGKTAIHIGSQGLTYPEEVQVAAETKESIDPIIDALRQQEEELENQSRELETAYKIMTQINPELVAQELKRSGKTTK